MPRRSRPARPVLETLEGRPLLSAVGLRNPSRVTARAEAKPGEDAEKAGKKETLKRLRVTIYGVLVPGPIATGKPEHGAFLVAGGVKWELDLSAVKGLDDYARFITRKVVAAYGSAEIEVDETGEQKRKLKVNWLEPIGPSGMPPAFKGLPLSVIAGLPTKP